MTEPHFRRCLDCGAISTHSGGVVPEVLCKRCGSQDTRRMKSEPPLWIGIGSIHEGRGLYVPLEVAKCPECGDCLIARCHEHELESGRPVATGIEIECCQPLRSESIGGFSTLHKFRQDDWQHVRDAVAKWCDARDDYPRR